MHVLQPDIASRCNRPTPNKRGAQVAMIKAIQAACGEERPPGHWMHTAGPGKIAINYWIHEQAFHPDAEYIIIEYFKKFCTKINQEADRLRRILRSQPWSNKIRVHHREIFAYATKLIRAKEHILVVEADLCSRTASLVEGGILNSIQELQQTYDSMATDPLFLALTYCIRGRTWKDRWALSQINHVLKNKGASIIQQTAYRDGANMETTTWQLGRRQNDVF